MYWWPAAWPRTSRPPGTAAGCRSANLHEHRRVHHGFDVVVGGVHQPVAGSIGVTRVSHLDSIRPRPRYEGASLAYCARGHRRRALRALMMGRLFRAYHTTTIISLYVEGPRREVSLCWWRLKQASRRSASKTPTARWPAGRPKAPSHSAACRPITAGLHPRLRRRGAAHRRPAGYLRNTRGRARA